MGAQYLLCSCFILCNMEEKELFKYGDKELNVNSLISNITSNQKSYLDYYSTSISDVNSFTEKLNYIKEGIKRGSITTDGSGKYYDTNNKLLKDDVVMSNALHYVDIIAKELSKKTTPPIKQQTVQQEKPQDVEKQEVKPDGTKTKQKQGTVKQAFTPSADWSVAKAFTHSFNNNGQIPYEVLQQLITVGEDGKEVYTDLHDQLSKNFDKVSKQLQAFNNTESYITSINAFKNALKDGNLSPQDRLLGMELGFQSSELDKLSNLIQYKVNQQDPEPVVAETTEELQDIILNNPELQQQPLERDDFYQERVNRYYANLQKNKDFANKAMNYINWELFDSPKSIKSDSEEEFRNFLVTYINSKLIASMDRNFVNRYPATPYGGYGTPELKTKFTNEHLQYIDPKMYNILGLKFFSKYTTTNMYKHFKELVEKQNKEQVQANKEGGIIKAQGGVKVPIKFDFDSIDYLSLNELNDFTSYDSKQMAELLNSISAEYQTFSGEASDGVEARRKAVADFIARLKESGDISTGTGILSYDSKNDTWNHRDQASPLSATDEVVEETVDNVASNEQYGNAKPVDADQLRLKQLNLKKPIDLNPDGIVNSLAGYIVNEVANAKKQEIQKTLPLYQEIYDPEKAFRTAYTYDLETAKNKIVAEATGLKPITSDASVYYAARNEAIKNAREYTTKLDAHINDVIHQTASENQDIAFSNAQARTNKANINAKYRHEWEVEQKQGEIDRIEASNQSFQNLNKEFKNSIVTRSRSKQKQRDAYMQNHIIDSIKISPANYIEGWTKYHDSIWHKGQTGQLTTEEEQIAYQQLQAVVQQAISSIMAQYQGINYQGRDTLHVPEELTKPYEPSIKAKGGKIDKHRINNFVNKLK